MCFTYCFYNLHFTLIFVFWLMKCYGENENTGMGVWKWNVDGLLKKRVKQLMDWSLVNVSALFTLIAIYTPFKPIISIYTPSIKKLEPPTGMGPRPPHPGLCLGMALKKGLNKLIHWLIFLVVESLGALMKKAASLYYFKELKVGNSNVIVFPPSLWWWYSFLLERQVWIAFWSWKIP